MTVTHNAVLIKTWIQSRHMNVIVKEPL